MSEVRRDSLRYYNQSPSEPTVYKNSYFGDGSVPIVYSNLGCHGYENTVLDCSREEFGSFSCSRNNIAGVTCQDSELAGGLHYYINDIVIHTLFQ